MYPKREKNVSLNYITDTVQCANTQEYVFLSAGKFMPGMEKLAGELFFPTNQQLFLTTEGSKNSWF